MSQSIVSGCDSVSMYSLPVLEMNPEDDEEEFSCDDFESVREDTSNQASTNFSQGENNSKFTFSASSEKGSVGVGPGKTLTRMSKGKTVNGKRISLDLKKVAQFEDSVVVRETEFEEDCQSADEFAEQILNTNLIINKQSTSFGKKQQRPSQAEIFASIQKPSKPKKNSTKVVRLSVDLTSEESETEMAQIPDTKGVSATAGA